jgi:hypothetical protein
MVVIERLLDVERPHDTQKRERVQRESAPARLAFRPGMGIIAALIAMPKALRRLGAAGV